MKIIISATLVILLNVISFAQRTFAPLDAKWTYEGWSDGTGWEPNWQGDCGWNSIVYNVESEVLIEGKLCGVIKRESGFSTYDSLVVWDDGEIVYFYENNTFFKLFDYTASVGDTVWSFRPMNAGKFSLKTFATFEYEHTDSIATIILSYDTIMINGLERKRWETEALYTDNVRFFETIIEGIGSLNGIIGDHNLLIGEGCYGGFVCYEDSAITLASTTFPFCGLPLSNTKLEVGRSINISPNPCRDILHITLEKEIALTKINIYDINGKRILSEKFKNNIDITKQVPATYIMELISDDGISYFKRFIKIDE